MRATYAPSIFGTHHIFSRQGLSSFSANRRRTVSRERLSCAVRRTISPASGSMVQQARPLGGLEHAVATRSASSWTVSVRAAPGPLGSVTADGTSDGEPVYRAVAERQPDSPVAVIIPPRATATLSAAAGTTPRQRDEHIQMIRDKGRLGWQKAVGYGRRALGETAMFRYKAVIGRGLRARTLPAQKTEARIGCAVLNRMMHISAQTG